MAVTVRNGGEKLKIKIERNEMKLEKGN